MAEYTVKFGVDTISKRSIVRRRNGEMNVTTDATLEDMRREDNAKTLKDMFYMDVHNQVKDKIFNIEILEIDVARPKKPRRKKTS